MKFKNPEKIFAKRKTERSKSKPGGLPGLPGLAGELEGNMEWPWRPCMHLHKKNEFHKKK